MYFIFPILLILSNNNNTRYGDKAVKFLSALSVFAKENTFAIPHHDLMKGLRHSIAAALQRGNALIVLAGYANSERAFRQ